MSVLLEGCQQILHAALIDVAQLTLGSGVTSGCLPVHDAADMFVMLVQIVGVRLGQSKGGGLGEQNTEREGGTLTEISTRRHREGMAPVEARQDPKSDERTT